MYAILKENTANYISLERLMDEDLPVSSIPQKKIANNRKMTMCNSIEFIGYQIQAHWQNNCTVLITKHQ